MGLYIHEFNPCVKLLHRFCMDENWPFVHYFPGTQYKIIWICVWDAQAHEGAIVQCCTGEQTKHSEGESGHSASEWRSKNLKTDLLSENTSLRDAHHHAKNFMINSLIGVGAPAWLSWLSVRLLISAPFMI